MQLALLRESAPQAGVVIFTALMSRTDWILIGIIVSSAKLAEYSFAWKIFELSMLPLLVTAPLILPLFSRLYKNPYEQTDTSFFLQWQIVIASLSAMILNLCWAPVIDPLTDGKYGAINSVTVFLLSLSLPVIYFNNYLWTINFAKGKLRYIFGVIGASFAVNIIACLILIPIYQNEGAAFGNLLGVLTQLAFYLRSTPLGMEVNRKYFLLLPPAAALLCGYLAVQLNTPLPASIVIAIALYTSIIIIGGQLRISDWSLMKSLYH